MPHTVGKRDACVNFVRCEDVAMDRDPDAAEVKAAGCVVWRRGEDAGLQIALAHRPRYEDWSLPKGKLDPGETWEQAAVREVEEEIGVEGELGTELPPVFYRDRKGREKAVRYWTMEAGGGTFAVNDEVDELRWVPPAEALALLSYDKDRELVRHATEVLTP